MSEKITPQAYANVFEDHHEGRLIYEDLIKRFGGNPWMKGGRTAERETTKRLGMREVMEYITIQINRAHGVDDYEEHNTSDPDGKN